MRRRLAYADVSGNLSVSSRKVSSITANLYSVTYQKSEHLEVTSLIIIGGPPVVECLGWGGGWGVEDRPVV